MKNFKTGVLIFLILAFPLVTAAQIPPGLHANSFQTSFRMILNTPPANLLTPDAENQLHARENRCLKIGHRIGLLSGAGIGLLHTYWSVRYTPDPKIPIWKHLLAGLPPTVMSTYVGSKTMKWATRQIMKGNPNPGMAILKGAFFGGIAGTTILASNYIPFFISSYYLGTIHFNDLGKGFVPLRLIGISVLGSIAYGGTFGTIAGGVYGPCISFYLRF